jgi:hypothetical protein
MGSIAATVIVVVTEPSLACSSLVREFGFFSFCSPSPFCGTDREEESGLLNAAKRHYTASQNRNALAKSYRGPRLCSKIVIIISTIHAHKQREDALLVSFCVMNTSQSPPPPPPPLVDRCSLEKRVSVAAPELRR